MDEVLVGHQSILEAVVSGTSLTQALTAIACAFEAQHPDLFCSILLVDSSGKRLTWGTAPSLPPEYRESVDGVLIGPKAGSCGTAASRGEMVIVTDIATDPVWETCRDIALRHNLRACWSLPVFSARNKLLGTVGVYLKESREPTTSEVKAVHAAASLVRLAIEHKRSDEERNALAQIHERTRLVAKATKDVVWDWDLTNNTLWWNEGMQTLFGYPPEAVEPGIESWSNRIHPDDHERVAAGVHFTLESDAQIWSDEYRFRRYDGSYAYIYDRGFITRDVQGRAIRVVGTMVDITPRRQLEEAAREHQRMLSTLLSNLPGAAYRCRNDPNWTAEFVSDGILALTGYPPADFIDNQRRAFSDLIHEDDGQRVWDEVQAAIAKRQPFQTTYRITCADGEEKWVWEQGRAVYGPDGEISSLEGFLTDVTGAKRGEQALKESQQRLRMIIQISNVGLWDWDLKTDKVYFSPEWKSQLGYEDHEISNDFDEWRRRVHPDDLKPAEAAIDAYLRRTGEPTTYENESRMRHKDGSYRWIYVRAEILRAANGAPVRMLGCHIDITERKAHEEATAQHAVRQEIVAALGQFALGHRELDDLMNRVVSSVARGLNVSHSTIFEYDPRERHLMLRATTVWDPHGPSRLMYLAEQESMETYCLKRREAVVSDDFDKEKRFVSQPSDHEVKSGVAVVIYGGEGPYGVLSACSAQARRYSPDEINFVQSVANVLSAAIERREAEQRLSHLAQFDPLTGLPNRNLFRDRLARAVARAQRDDLIVALLFLDLDRFKEINDTLGHEAGDHVLKDVSARLRSCLRAGDTIARLGGDEFTVILEEMANPIQVRHVAEKILRVFATPVQIDRKEFFVTPSIGVALFPTDGADGEVLLKHADIAMYHAKNEGRNNAQFYNATMSVAATDRMSLEHSLRQAIERQEFLVYYQPIVNLSTGALVSMEALLRWQHPEWGLVEPDRFIRLAEQTGLIVPIGEWVLREVCAQSARWQQAGLPPVRVAVNLSARQFRKSNLVTVIADALRTAGISGNLLELEITESLLMESPEVSSRLLDNLKTMGVHVTLDDFGTGYSSFSYLKHFPLDTVKVDRSFVRDVTSDPDDAAIVTGMIELAHSLYLKVVAEGTETAQQVDFLRKHKCDYAQGYVFSRPRLPDDLQEILRSREIIVR